MRRKVYTDGIFPRNYFGGYCERIWNVKKWNHFRSSSFTAVRKIVGGIKSIGIQKRSAPQRYRGFWFVLRGNRGFSIPQFENQFPSPSERPEGFRNPAMSAIYLHPAHRNRFDFLNRLWRRLCPFIVDGASFGVRGFFRRSRALDFFYAQSNGNTTASPINIYRKRIGEKLQTL